MRLPGSLKSEGPFAHARTVTVSIHGRMSKSPTEHKQGAARPNPSRSHLHLPKMSHKTHFSLAVLDLFAVKTSTAVHQAVKMSHQLILVHKNTLTQELVDFSQSGGRKQRAKKVPGKSSGVRSCDPQLATLASLGACPSCSPATASALRFFSPFILRVRSLDRSCFCM